MKFFISGSRHRSRRGAFRLPTFSPFQLAACITLSYLVIGISYIVISGMVAAEVARTVEELQRIEKIKGVLFIVVTDLGLLGLAYLLLRRVAARERQVSHQREALILAENRALAGVMSACVAHDINNILTVVDYVVNEQLPPESENEQYQAHVTELQRANERLKELTRRLVTVAGHHDSDTFGPIDLVQVISETIDLAKTHKEMRNCLLTCTSEESAIGIVANPTLLHQMMLNLILNARESIAAHGIIEVRIRQNQGKLCLEVHDNGSGIPTEQREDVFKPFFTTKSKGTGLGLLSVKACAEAHHGGVEIDDSPLGGACFRIFLGTDPAKVPDKPETKRNTLQPA